MKTWGIFTIIYTLLAIILISRFNNDLFITDHAGTAVIALIIYITLSVLYLLVKWIKKSIKPSL